jgi:MurNAc alpha-1-phosphate uridylyltransferase
MYPLAILAGGLATRLYPMTQNIPKSMVEIAGQPFIDWQLKMISTSGFTKVVLCLGDKGDQVKNFVGNGSKYGLDVSYSFDGEKALGTGGAIAKALPILGDNFGVTFGDSYLPIDFKSVCDIFNQSEKKALMTIYKNLNQFGKSNVEFVNGKIITYSKNSSTKVMEYIDYGFSIFRKEVFLNIPKDEFLDLGDVIEKIVKDGDLEGFEVKQRFYEIGSFEGIQEISNYLKGSFG